LNRLDLALADELRPRLSRRAREHALDLGEEHEQTCLHEHGDLGVLEDLGFNCEGWDPVHRPEGKRRESDVVNLGYVVNVIEDSEERADALRTAWGYARKALIVAARVDIQDRADDLEAWEQYEAENGIIY
jgi:DNA phosphorothioation-associated putative methyltransferase